MPLILHDSQKIPARGRGPNREGRKPEQDKAWNFAKGACLLWQEFRSYHRAGGPIVWASLFAPFLAMKRAMQKGLISRGIIMLWRVPSHRRNRHVPDLFKLLTHEQSGRKNFLFVLLLTEPKVTKTQSFATGLLTYRTSTMLPIKINNSH